MLERKPLSYSSQSPPWYSLALYAFDAIYWGLGWLACMYYGNKIAHPDLVATMVATISSIEFIIGEHPTNVGITRPTPNGCAAAIVV